MQGCPMTERHRPRFGLNRRAVLLGAVGVAAFVGRAVAADAPLVATDLPGGLTLISGAGGNVICARGKDGAVMVDSGTAAHAAELAALVKKRTGQEKVATLFNTCWRLEQTGGNDAFGAAVRPEAGSMTHHHGVTPALHAISSPWLRREVI